MNWLTKIINKISKWMDERERTLPERLERKILIEKQKAELEKAKSKRMKYSQKNSQHLKDSLGMTDSWKPTKEYLPSKKW